MPCGLKARKSAVSPVEFSKRAPYQQGEGGLSFESEDLSEQELSFTMR